MKQIKWFDRKFEFSFEQHIFPSILERLDRTSLRLNDKIKKISAEQLTKRNNSWSIQENVGYLIDLEPIWQSRLEDILSNQKYLRTADLYHFQLKFTQ